MKQNKKLSDQEVLSLLKEDNDESVNNAFKAIYEQVFPMVKHLVLGNSGSNEEALDIFQDTAIIFYNNVIEDKYKNTSSISSYIYAIARNQWHLHLRKNKHFSNRETLEKVELGEMDESESDKLYLVKTVGKFLDQLDEDCRKLLDMFYYEDKSMKKIKEAFDLGSEQAAKTKKFRCMKKLQELFKSNKIRKDSFIR